MYALSVLHNALDFGLVIFMTDKVLGIGNGILGVGMEHVLFAITNTGIDGTIKVVEKREGKHTCQW